MDGTPQMPPMTAIDPQADPRGFRDALGRFGTGVTVVTAQNADGDAVGITANSFASVSLDPALVLWSPAKASKRYPIFCDATNFAIHVLGTDQASIAGGFVKGAHAFDGLSWSRNAAGTPLIDGCLARFECKQVACHDAGDHSVIIGAVENCAIGDGSPLMFFAGGFGGFSAGS